jgi:hypothetical protein
MMPGNESNQEQQQFAQNNNEQSPEQPSNSMVDEI